MILPSLLRSLANAPDMLHERSHERTLLWHASHERRVLTSVKGASEENLTGFDENREKHSVLCSDHLVFS